MTVRVYEVLTDEPHCRFCASHSKHKQGERDWVFELRGTKFSIYVCQMCADKIADTITEWRTL